MGGQLGKDNADGKCRRSKALGNNNGLAAHHSAMFLAFAIVLLFSVISGFIVSESACASGGPYTVHYMWKSETASGYSEVKTIEGVPAGSYSVLPLASANIFPTAGCTTFAYGKTTVNSVPSSMHEVSLGMVTPIEAETWFWANETRNTYPVHYMYGTGTTWQEVRLVTKVPHGNYTTLAVSALYVSPEYPDIIRGYGKTTNRNAPNSFSEVEPGKTTVISQETWLWLDAPSFNPADLSTLSSIRGGTVFDAAGRVIVSGKYKAAYNKGKPVCPVSYVITKGGRTVAKNNFLTYYFKNRKKGVATVVLRGIHSKGYKDAIILAYKIV